MDLQHPKCGTEDAGSYL